MGFPPFSWLESSIGENRSWAPSPRDDRDSVPRTRVDSGDDRFCSRTRLLLRRYHAQTDRESPHGMAAAVGEIHASGTTIWCSGSSASRSSPAGWAGRRRRDAPLTNPPATRYYSIVTYVGTPAVRPLGTHADARGATPRASLEVTTYPCRTDLIETTTAGINPDTVGLGPSTRESRLGTVIRRIYWRCYDFYHWLKPW